MPQPAGRSPVLSKDKGCSGTCVYRTWSAFVFRYISAWTLSCMHIVCMHIVCLPPSTSKQQNFVSLLCNNFIFSQSHSLTRLFTFNTVSNRHHSLQHIDTQQPSCWRYQSSGNLCLETRLQKPCQVRSRPLRLDTLIFCICLRQSERSIQPTCNGRLRLLHILCARIVQPDPLLSHNRQAPRTTPQE